MNMKYLLPRLRYLLRATAFFSLCCLTEFLDSHGHPWVGSLPVVFALVFADATLAWSERGRWRPAKPTYDMTSCS